MVKAVAYEQLHNMQSLSAPLDKTEEVRGGEGKTEEVRRGKRR